ncbi:MAG: gliding motility-associated C-terminal domain-containing protein [Bacteroidetes bacterium]|nr:gliding motility-associated C-terminal domain-containing protein [Bacteroidota bacterium]
MILHIANTLLKKFTIRICCLLITVFCLPSSGFTYHIAALNITYRYAGPNRYIITVKMYRDCQSINIMTTDIDVQYKSDSCGLSGIIKLPLVTGDKTGNPGTGNFISLPCLGVTSCNTSQYGVEEFEYEDTLQLPASCPDWIISHETPGKRNYNDILVNSQNQNIFVWAMIDNLNAPQNSSPLFDKPPVAIFCVGFEYFFNQGASELIDGDSLVYALSPAQGANGDTIPYITSPVFYSYDNPLNVTDFYLDPINGIIHFTPDKAMVSVFCIIIYEYRNGQLIGIIKTDMQSVVSASNNCSADTLAFIGDTTQPTGNNPAKSDSCLTTQIMILFNSSVKCESVTNDGSEFLIFGTDGDTIAIDSVTYSCDTLGLTDTIFIHLSEPMAVILNGSYYVIGKKGNDGDPLMSACDRPLAKDTLEIRVRDCPIATVDLRNVTVTDNQKIAIQWVTSKMNFPDTFFVKYEFCRSPVPVDECDFVAGTSLNFSDSIFNDLTADVALQPYNYTVKLYQEISLLDTLSDSIQSIFLSADSYQADTQKFSFAWTPYWGWQNPVYTIFEKTGDDGAWKAIDSTSLLFYVRTKPLLAQNYRIKVETHDYANRLTSESNWVKYSVNIWQVPNVITPNGDGVNDRFFVNEILLRGKTRLIVYNRWGFKVFDDDNYNNNWKGTKWNGVDLEEGTYFYVLDFADGTAQNGFVLILR